MLSSKEYKAARHMLNEHEKAVRKYLKANKTNAIPFETKKTFPYAKHINNNLRSNIEVYEFVNEKPEKYFLYIDEEKRIATTFMGDKLGAVNFGNEYRDNFGSIRVPIDVYGVNRRVYHGTYYKSAGDYARIKQYKNQ